MSVNNIKFFINFMCYRLFTKFYLIVLIVEVTVLIITVMFTKKFTWFCTLSVTIVKDCGYVFSKCFFTVYE